MFDKSLDLKRLCKAKVFLLVVDEDERRKHMLSTEPLSQTWPPSGTDLVRYNCLSSPAVHHGISFQIPR